MLSRALVAICVISLLGIFGCATLNKTQTGFLNDYSELKESVRYPGALVDSRNLAKMNNYDKYIIEPVVVHYADPQKNKNVPDDTANEIASYFTSELIKDLQDKYPLVTIPGPGVLRIRVAITDIAASQPLLNISPTTKLTGAGSGGACIEGEAIDSVTGERIFAFVDCRKGSQWNVTGGLDQWQYAKDACASWAKSLRERLDAGFKEVAP
jgi:hypothetical protein